MGYIRHHAIVVVGDSDHLEKARDLAVELFSDLCVVSPIVESAMNGYGAFFIPPDGSKEFWPTSYRGEIARADFRKQVKTLEGHSGYCTVTEVCLGDEDGPDRIVSEDEGRDTRIRALAEVDSARTNPIDL